MGRVPDFQHLEAISCSFRCRIQDHVLIARSPTNSTFIDSVRKVCASDTQHSRKLLMHHVQDNLRGRSDRILRKLSFAELQSSCRTTSVCSNSLLACRGAVIGTMRKTIDNRQSNTMLNYFGQPVRSISRKPVSLICQAVSTCMSSGPRGAPSFDFDRVLKGFSCGFFWACDPCGAIMELVGMFSMSHERLDLRSQWLEESDCIAHISHVHPDRNVPIRQVIKCLRFLGPLLLLAPVNLMPSNAIEFLQTSGFVFDRSHEIVCYVLMCHGRSGDVLTQLEKCRPYPCGGNLHVATPVPTNEGNTRNEKFHRSKNDGGTNPHQTDR